MAQYQYKLENQMRRFGDTCEIRCAICGKVFKSSLNHSSAKKFLDSIVFTKEKCPTCGNIVQIPKNKKKYCYKIQIVGKN